MTLVTLPYSTLQQLQQVVSCYLLGPPHLLSMQSHSGSMQAPGATESPREDGLLFLHQTNQIPAEQSYNPALSAKRRRWESVGSESPLGSGKACRLGRQIMWLLPLPSIHTNHGPHTRSSLQLPELSRFLRSGTN